MNYSPGDYVSPADLPRRSICRVLNAEPIGAGHAQILKLEPLEGPWPRGTFLVRLNSGVVPVDGNQRAREAQVPRRVVTCAATRTTAIVQLEALRVVNCSRWPEREGCDRGCIVSAAG